jgi:signal transduction histidine kinase
MLSNKISTRIRKLKWVFPLSIAGLVIIYQLIVTKWIHETWGGTVHFVVELLFYATAGPLFAYLILDVLERWMEERETSELQAKILQNARQSVDASRELSDNALQSLYAASVYLSSLKFSQKDLPVEAKETIGETERVLGVAMHDLRQYLQNQTGNNNNHH